MQKLKNYVLASLFLVAFFVFAPDSFAQQKEGNPQILVMPFEINAPADIKAQMSDALPEMIRDSLRNLGFRVVPKAASGTAAARSKDAAQRAARESGASAVVYGSYTQAGEAISIDARVLTPEGQVSPVYATRPASIQTQPAAEEIAAKTRALLQKDERIVSVDVEGNFALDKDVILLKIKSQPGEIYDPKVVNEDLKRLFELGYFDDAQIRLDDDQGGKRLVFVLKEKPRIQAISVVGASEVSKDDILEVMSTRAGAVLNLKILSEDLNKIRDLYHKKGFYNAQVSYDMEQTDPRIARLNIQINEAKKLYIKKITIEGAKQVSESDLKDELAMSEAGILSWITNSGLLKEEMLDRDTAAIETYYSNRGFLEVKVSQPVVDIQEDGIYITFQVEEGERYRMGELTFKGELLAPEEELQTMVKLDELSKDNDYFNRAIMRDDVNRLTEYYADFGYAFADCSPDLQPNEESKTVDVTYELSKGRKVYIRRVLIEGNEKTRDNVIRREMRLADGSLFSGSKLRRSHERLTKMDYFDKVDIEPVPTDNPEEVDLSIKVKDKNTGSINLGVGYSSYDSVFVGGGIEERNLFGKGYVVSAQGQLSWRSNRFILNFTNPRLYDSNLSVGVEAYRMWRDFYDYYMETYGFRLRTAYPIGEYTVLFADYRLEHYDMRDVDWFTSQQILEAKDIHWSSMLYLGVTRDSTDNKTRPTKGTVVTLGTEIVGGFLGGDQHYVRPSALGHFFYPLFGEGAGTHVFHWKGFAGILFEQGSKSVPVFERYYLGGINTVRGYEQDRISPRDPLTKERVGGLVALYTNFEYIFPISKEYGIQGVGFFDAGNVWKRRSNFDFDLWKSVGIGLRWHSPMGLIRVEYGYGMDAYRQGQYPHQIGFTMGQSF